MEKYLVIEWIKKQEYGRLFSNNYFWWTYDQNELDWVEERDGHLFGYEFKWDKMCKAPTLWFETYPQSKYESITKDNYIPFIA